MVRNGHCRNYDLFHLIIWILLRIQWIREMCCGTFNPFGSTFLVYQSCTYTLLLLMCWFKKTTQFSVKCTHTWLTTPWHKQQVTEATWGQQQADTCMIKYWDEYLIFLLNLEANEQSWWKRREDVRIQPAALNLQSFTKTKKKQTHQQKICMLNFTCC